MNRKKFTTLLFSDMDLIKIYVSSFALYGVVSIIPLWWVRLLIVAALSATGFICMKKATDYMDEEFRAQCPYNHYNLPKPVDCIETDLAGSPEPLDIKFGDF